ncbi:hybrid sensor histidine kinase/response regulator [Caulobacter flavus]|jgi:signal transduction histidine kinase|uniref:histidine kinase n=1 Tax=Caulobacter flavus TaxID=1679497 RepID=A0A2N5CVU1_9CAUL|nr:response regulator [Caulobacter flavus]AYV46987.1 hybrid sensor histidine kinase/response regulator [Caulobacter flavus]PLR17896.1 hybrid sensor histidine kinase/response regulator [Caulobacter flavus]
MSVQSGERPTILVVDDEPDILVALEDLLEDRYRVLTSNAPGKALDILAQEPSVALILSDQRMPGLTGDQFLAAARSISDADSILLTGYADLSAVVSALNLGGVSGYVAKPWEPEALRAAVAAGVERTRLRRALRTEQALLRGLMDSIPAVIAFKDAQGRVVRTNASDAHPFADAPEGAEALAAGQPVQVVTEEATLGGPVWTERQYVPLRDEAGHLLVIERDVTDQKMAEIRLRQADKLQALGTLAGGVAHDFNNLLTAILGSLELAGRRLPDADKVRRYLDNASLAARKGAALTHRLLGFSRQQESQPKVVDVADTLMGMDAILVRTLGGAVRIAWDLPADLWPAHVEPDQLELAVLNLSVNARDAMPGGGVISISARNFAMSGPTARHDLPDGDYVLVTVRDTGEGISPELMARIFEPFFTTKPVGKGTGLGLSMVYGFAQRSGGAIDIESQPGEGTAVNLYLPRGSGDCGPGEDCPPVDVALDKQPSRSVLVVDDDPTVRAVTVAMVRDLGHRVIEAEDGEQALRRVRETRPDLMIADFAMPGMTGLELARAAQDLAPGIRVILVTGHADVTPERTDLSLVRKPFENRELADRIRSVLADA